MTNNDYGTTNYNGKKYTLTECADFDGKQDVRIDNSIYVVDNNHVSALAVDEEENECIVYFNVLNDNLDMDSDDFADWNNATYVEEL